MWVLVELRSIKGDAQKSVSTRIDTLQRYNDSSFAVAMVIAIACLCMWNSFCTFADVKERDKRAPQVQSNTYRNNMKIRVFAAIILCALGIEAFAQASYNPNAGEKRIPSGVGFNIGFTRDLLLERKGDNESKKFPYRTALNGFKVGVVYDATIVKGFGVSMALNYTIAGAKDRDWRKEKNNQLGAYPQIKDSYLFQSIELPIDWQYKFEIAKETYLILYTGPTVQYNFSFTQTQHKQQTPTSGETTKVSNHYSASTTPNTNENSNPFGDADNDGKQDYHEWNITWGVGAGFQYQRYFLRGGYDFGIFNPYKDRFIDNGVNKYNKGRLDQWNIKIGMYLWEF